MSRSRRKTPIGSWAKASSEKRFKQDCNNVFNAKQRAILKKLKDDPESDLDIHLPRHLRDVVEPWTGPKDGKMYFGNMKDKAYVKKQMRK